MDELNNHHDKLEANIGTLKKFDGLEGDLIKFHVDLRAQFSEYREAIEAANLSEIERKAQRIRYEELLKTLHKLILEAKHLARKRTEQMTRDELFKMSQERLKAAKPQTAEDKIGEEVTKSLKRMLETMRTEVERSSTNISTARSTSKNLQGTSDNYEKLSGTLDESKGLIRDLWKRNRMDMIYIVGALGVFIATVAYVLVQRTPGVVWMPGRAVYRTLINLMPRSGENVVEKFVQVTESIFSDSDDPEDHELFVDQIQIDDKNGDVGLLKGSEEIEKSALNESDHAINENYQQAQHFIVENIDAEAPADENNLQFEQVQERSGESIEFATQEPVDSSKIVTEPAEVESFSIFDPATNYVDPSTDSIESATAFDESITTEQMISPTLNEESTAGITAEIVFDSAQATEPYEPTEAAAELLIESTNDSGNVEPIEPTEETVQEEIIDSVVPTSNSEYSYVESTALPVENEEYPTADSKERIQNSTIETNSNSGAQAASPSEISSEERSYSSDADLFEYNDEL